MFRYPALILALLSGASALPDPQAHVGADMLFIVSALVLVASAFRQQRRDAMEARGRVLDRMAGREPR